MGWTEGHPFRGCPRGDAAGRQDGEDGGCERDERPAAARDDGPLARGSSSGHRETRNVASQSGAGASAGRKDDSILYCAGPMLNPLRSEGEMFRLLLYVIAVFAAIIALVLILRAIF
jgi:hypothetical protein